MPSLTRELADRLGDPALTSRWYATLFGLEGAGPGDLEIESVLVPTLVGNPHPRFYGGRYYEFPGTHSIGQATLQIFEWDDYRVTKLMEKWRRKIFSPDAEQGGVAERYGLPVEYAKKVSIELYPVDRDSPLCTIELQRAWLIHEQDKHFDYIQIDGRIVVVINLSVGGVLIKQ